MPYTETFGGTAVYPSDVTYLALALSTNAALVWPVEADAGDNPAARIIDITSTGAFSVTLPNATMAAPGEAILFNNLSASTNSVTLKDASGATLATIGIGEQWQAYLSSNATSAGTWRVLRYGASTASVQASALAGYGMTVTSNQLSQSTPVTTFSSSPRTLLTSDRASMFVWTGTGAGTINLPAAATAGNNYYFAVRNAGGGDLTIDPASTELIDGAATITLRPGDSTSVATDGLAWYSLGLGQKSVFAFDYTSISVTGGTYTLSGSELNRVAYKFVGTLTSNLTVVVPSTVQQYWVDNGTTGAFTLSLKTSSGTAVGVNQGSRGIYYCNGANVVNAATAGISVPILATDGGTGQTSYTVGDILYASGTTALSRLADVTTGNALISGGTGVAPSWGKVGLSTHVSGTLATGNGGTGVTTAANGQVLIGNGTGFSLATLTQGSGVSITNSAGGITIAATGSGGTVTSVGMTVPAFLSVAGSPITGSGTLAVTLSGTALPVANGGTGSTSTTFCNLTTNVTGTLPVANGGTGLATMVTDNVYKGAGTGALAPTIIFDTGTNVGVGTGSPGAKLDVFTNNAGAGAYAKITNNSGSANSFAALSFDPGNGGVDFRDGQVRGTTNGSNAITMSIWTANGAVPTVKLAVEPAGVTRPGADNTYTLGSASFRWSQLFAGTTTINTSDERSKTEIGPIPEEWLDAWGEVEWCRYKFKDAVAEKGDAARWHTGLIAQRIRDVFLAHGIDALQIGILCFDAWEDGFDSATGDPIKAGDRWGLRYDECFALEAAWTRREMKRLRPRKYVRKAK